MLIYEYKVAGTKKQYAAIDEAIRIVQFVRNKCVRKWMDERGVSSNDLQCYCAVLAKDYAFASSLNSQPVKWNALVTSHDLIAFEDLKIANLVKNHSLTKSISDAAWGRFLSWVTYYAIAHAVPGVAVAPHWTSQQCSGCRQIVKKSLSERTHRCVHCGLVMDRDENAARNILVKALHRLKTQGCTVGQTETGTPRRVRKASGQKTTTISQQ